MITLQRVNAQDEVFLYEVYAQTRDDEMQAMGWNGEQWEEFLNLQFVMQKRSYAMQYPAAEHHIILLDGVRIGRIMTEDTEDSLLLIDVSLLSNYRNKGIGTCLLRDLQQQASEVGKIVRLHVLSNNPAQGLYARLGFRVTEERFPYLKMEWDPRNEEVTNERGFLR